MPETFNQFPEGVTLVPPGALILVRWLKDERSSVGGILLPDSHKERQSHRHCVVEALGPAVPDHVREQLKVGDFVITTYAGDEIKVGRKSFININAGNVQSIVRDLPDGYLERRLARDEAVTREETVRSREPVA